MSEKASTELRKSQVSNNITNYYDSKKIEFFSKMDIDDDVEKYIKPIFDKNGNIISYKIYFDRNTRYQSKSKMQNIELIFIRLKNILLKAKELKSKNC